ncbi:MAG: 4Fe-4S binding protein [Sinimarinibacterium sp.]|jgi:NosR/NirI family nitrous oxide reductase transcriptional regulator
MKALARIVALLAFAFAGVLAASSYEAPLPAQLATDPDLCAHLPCGEVLPGAANFSPRKGRPTYVEGYRDEGGQRQLLGYVFLSTDIVDIPAYSGKPVVTLIGMDAAGRITGVKILRHSEPILLLGIPEAELTRFIKQYEGKFVGDKIEIGRSREADGYIGLDAISGATVTVIAENQVVLRSGLQIARQVGILKPTIRPPARFTAVADKRDWAALVDEGSIHRLTVQPAEVGIADTGAPYIDLHFGYLNAPAVGRSVLGDRGYENLMSRLAPGEHAIFVIGSGASSFKGSGFVRGGIYDRVQVAQDLDTFTFRDLDYLNLYGIEAAGAPAYRESAIFIIRSPAFSPAYPWNLVFLGNRMDPASGARTFVSFDREYWLPARYLEGGRPAVDRPEAPWVQAWKAKAFEIAAFVLLLLLAGASYAMRDRLTRASSRKDKTPVNATKYLFWSVSVVAVGFYAMAQPSITHVLTWFHSLIFHWNWELFLSDPLIFVFWWFIILTVFLWGRGLFCGWLCPFGAFHEILYKIAGSLGLKRFQFALPKPLHDKLKWVKYGVFAGLLGVSFYSMPLAEKLAEIEPFKTTFLVGVWNRSWPYAAWWTLLAGLALFMDRPFCKYLCPLGAALAVPTTFRFFGLKRKSECGPCDACAVGCSQLAIDSKGRIDPRECLLCLDCMVMYYDAHACPPLSKERKRRAKAGEPLTAIGADGYYAPQSRPISLAALTSGAHKPAAPKPVLFHNGRPQPTDAATLPQWLWQELAFHLLPWNRRFWAQAFGPTAVSAATAVVVTVAWLLTATGALAPAVTLAWWLGWSVYEILTRQRYKPWVKDGPWWRRDYRDATAADLIAYVATKNLLIGAALFLIAKAMQ